MATPCCWPTLGWRLLPAGDPQPGFASGLSLFCSSSVCFWWPCSGISYWSFWSTQTHLHICPCTSLSTSTCSWVLLDHLTSTETISTPGYGPRCTLTWWWSEHSTVCHSLWPLCGHLPSSSVPVLMNIQVYRLLAPCWWVVDSLDSFILTPITMAFPFCRSWEIHRFFCRLLLSWGSPPQTLPPMRFTHVCVHTHTPCPCDSHPSPFSLHHPDHPQDDLLWGPGEGLYSSHVTMVSCFYGIAIYNSAPRSQKGPDIPSPHHHHTCPESFYL